MRLDPKEFKRYKELSQKIKAGKATDSDKAAFEALQAKKDAKEGASNEFKPGNDFAWWNKIPELTKDSANFKCNWIPGTSIAPGAFTEPGFGVLAIYLDSVLGCNTAATDPVNVWARDLYLKMFQKYRPASGYTASDLGITLLAAYEVVKLIAFYERIYGIVNRYSVLNVNMPETEADALGLSAAQLAYLQGHLSDFRYDLNFLIRKAQRLCIPKDMSIIADAISLFGYEYMDHESIRSQIIVFNPVQYGVYSDIALQSGGCIEYFDLTQIFNFSADNMCVALNTALNALIGSDSVQRIFADLVVWFGQEAMLSFVPVPEDFVIAPVKSESILHKVHNLEMCQDAAYKLCSWIDSNLTSADQSYVLAKHMIYQCYDRIVTAVSKSYLPGGAVGGTEPYPIHGVNGDIYGTSAVVPACLSKGHVIDTAHLDITPDIIVEGAMWKELNIPFTSANNLNCIQIESSTFYTVRYCSLFNTLSSPTVLVNVGTAYSTTQMAAAYLACVDWAPLVYTLDSNNVVDNIFGDYDNIVFVSNPDLSRIQRTIVLSGLHTDVQPKAK